MFQIEGEKVDQTHFQVNTVRDNIKIIGRSKNWLTLTFREALAIKYLTPKLKEGPVKNSARYRYCGMVSNLESRFTQTSNIGLITLHSIVFNECLFVKSLVP